MELTYGLERFAMSLQGVDNLFDLEWARGVKYGTVRLRDEVEQSKYAFAHVTMPDGEFGQFHRNLFTQYYDFAWALLKSGLALPALDYCLKCSHAFNLLDSSGSIGVTERTSYILRVRQLAVAIAKAWTTDPMTYAGASAASPEQAKRVEGVPPVVSDRRESNHGS